MSNDKEANFNVRIKKYPTLVLMMLGIGAVFATGIVTMLPQQAVADHTSDDVVCPITHCVGTDDIADAAVTNMKIRLGAVTTSKIVNNGVTLAKLGPNSVDSSKIVDGSVALADLAANSVNTGKIVDGTIIKADINTSFMRAFTYNDDATGNAAGWNPDGVTTLFSVQSGPTGSDPTGNNSVILISMNNAGFGATNPVAGCFVYNWGVNVAGTGFADFKCVNAPLNGANLNIVIINP